MCLANNPNIIKFLSDSICRRVEDKSNEFKKAEVIPSLGSINFQLGS
jgi:hypothetical protein